MFIPNLITLFVFLISLTNISTFDPLSIGVGLISATKGISCYFGECCGKKYITGDFQKMETLFKENIYGQHIATRVIIDAIQAHWDSPHAKKALTLSLHGLVGTGKNYICKFIVESLYANGAQSKFVHHFLGRLHFTESIDKSQHKMNLYNWIKGNVTGCPQQVFIFDEIDKMPEGLLDIIKPIIDYSESVDNVDYRKCIFIFLSNTGSTLITNKLIDFWNQGVPRSEIQLHDFEKLISQGAFNEQGGFHHSDNIRSNLIDHYVPFLPMEVEHVKDCVRTLFKERGIENPPTEVIKEVIDFVEWGPEPDKLFSKTGCKRLSQKVSLVKNKWFPKTKSNEEI